MKKKLTAKTVWFFVTFVALSVTSQGVFGGELAFGLFVGGTYIASPIFLALITVASAALHGVDALLHCAVRVGVVLLAVGFHKLIKRKIGKYYLLLYLCLANVFYLVYDFTNYFDLFDKVLYVASGIAFSYVSVYAFRAVFDRGLNYRPATDELVCIALFAVVCSFCVSKITVWGMELIYLIIPFAVLCCSVVFGANTTLMAASLIGLGNVFATGAYDAFACAVLSGVAAVGLCQINRFVGALAVVAVDVIMSYFWGLHGSFTTLVFAPTVVSTLIFVVIPNSVYKYLADYYGGNARSYLNKSVAGKIGASISRRLYRLSDIFLSMKNAFFSMSAGTVSPEQAQSAIVKQCSETVCADCSSRSKCWRQDVRNTEAGLLALSSCAVRRGRCSILDVPQTLSVRCDRISSIISAVNTQATLYCQYKGRAEQADSSKLLLGEQMGGVSDLLLRLATDCKSRVNYDTDKERELIDRLVFHNVMCVGATIMQQAGVLTVVATVSSKDYNADTLVKVTSQLTRQNMVLDKIENTESAAWINVVMKVMPRFEVKFGVAAVSKDGSDASGDTHSVIGTDNGKCIVTLCDGMGSGAKAEKMSGTAISLVESFYRAGFDNDVILSCVNRLLSGSGNETFCAVDIVAFDVYNGLADFIKLGASIGLVKSCGEVEIVSGSSLPLGVLEEMTPSVTKKALREGDVIVLMSDGVSDCFGSSTAVAAAFAEITLTSPQSIADSLLAKAKRRCNNKPADDMTIVCIKITCANAANLPLAASA